jgi:nitronate monooxygenase
MNIRELFGIDLPIIQAPMAGVQGSAMAVAVSNAGGLGSLPCAMLTPDTLRSELQAITAQTTRPYNLNFFCHTPPLPDATREAAWRAALAPYYAEFGIDPGSVPAGGGRAPFTAEAADLLEGFKPRVVSFHFGLPSPDLLARVKGWGAKVLASATTVDEARWLEAHGVDAVIAQGLEAGGHRGIFLGDDLTTQVGTMALLPQIVRAVRVPVIAGRGCRHGARRGRRAGRHQLPAVPGGHHHAAAPGRTGQPARRAHRAHQPHHRPPGARPAQPPARRARPAERRGTGLPAGDRRPGAAEGRCGKAGPR